MTFSNELITLKFTVSGCGLTPQQEKDFSAALALGLETVRDNVALLSLFIRLAAQCAEQMGVPPEMFLEFCLSATPLKGIIQRVDVNDSHENPNAPSAGHVMRAVLGDTVRRRKRTR